MIKDAVRWEDHTVNAFDADSNGAVELVQYRGPYRDMCYRIVNDSNEQTQFWHGVKRRTIRQVKREDW